MHLSTWTPTGHKQPHGAVATANCISNVSLNNASLLNWAHDNKWEKVKSVTEFNKAPIIRTY